MKLDILRELNAERAARRAAVVITDVASGDRGPELAVPVKTRPDAVAADKTDAGIRQQ